MWGNTISDNCHTQLDYCFLLLFVSQLLFTAEIKYHTNHQQNNHNKSKSDYPGNPLPLIRFGFCSGDTDILLQKNSILPITEICFANTIFGLHISYRISTQIGLFSVIISFCIIFLFPV